MIMSFPLLHFDYKYTENPRDSTAARQKTWLKALFTLPFTLLQAAHSRLHFLLTWNVWKTKSETVNWKPRKSEGKSFPVLTAICSSRREHYIPRREHYSSQREHYISRRELQFSLSTGEDKSWLFRSFQFTVPDFMLRVRQGRCTRKTGNSWNRTQYYAFSNVFTASVETEGEGIPRTCL